MTHTRSKSKDGKPKGDVKQLKKFFIIVAIVTVVLFFLIYMMFKST